jgi:hypothetical protein
MCPFCETAWRACAGSEAASVSTTEAEARQRTRYAEVRNVHIWILIKL